MVVVVVLGRERADDVAVAESECSLVAALEDMRSRARPPKCVWSSLHLAVPLAEVMHACVLEMDAGQAVGRGWRLITDKRAARLCWLAVLCAAAGSRAGARPRFS